MPKRSASTRGLNSASAVLGDRLWALLLVRNILRLRRGGVPLYGTCDYQYRTILVSMPQHRTEMSVLSTILHEMFHVLWPDLSEEAVTRSADQTALMLWRIGVRFVPAALDRPRLDLRAVRRARRNHQKKTSSRWRSRRLVA